MLTNEEINRKKKKISMEIQLTQAHYLHRWNHR